LMTPAESDPPVDAYRLVDVEELNDQRRIG
jgi:hypothetical protein